LEAHFSIEIVVFGSGSVLASSEKRFEYVDDLKSPRADGDNHEIFVTDSTDRYVPPQGTDDFIVYRHVEGNWYIAFQFDG
jgi:hypothetical protein